MLEAWEKLSLTREGGRKLQSPFERRESKERKAKRMHNSRVLEGRET